MQDFNIREGSAISNSERKNVQTMNLRDQPPPRNVSRFDATDDYTDLQSKEYDEIYTPNRGNKKGSFKPSVAAFARPSATFPLAGNRDRTQERNATNKEPWAYFQQLG